MTKRQILLLRHAKSSWDDYDLSDHDRPLSARGLRCGELLRDFFRHEHIRPDLVLVSSARRALETLEALELPPPAPVETLRPLYHAPPQAILEILRAAPDAARVLLLIGHNPGLQEFAMQLCAARADPRFLRMADGFPTGAFAAFEIDDSGIADSWTQLAMGRGRLTRFITPKQLERAQSGA
jgi:phosphohistidine phosphatase